MDVKLSSISKIYINELITDRNQLDEASYRTLVKLTEGYNQLHGKSTKLDLPDQEKIAIAKAAIGIIAIDGIALSDEYIDLLYKNARGEVTGRQFDEYVRHGIYPGENEW